MTDILEMYKYFYKIPEPVLTYIYGSMSRTVGTFRGKVFIIHIFNPVIDVTTRVSWVKHSY